MEEEVAVVVAPPKKNSNLALTGGARTSVLGTVIVTILLVFVGAILGYFIPTLVSQFMPAYGTHGKSPDTVNLFSKVKNKFTKTTAAAAAKEKEKEKKKDECPFENAPNVTLLKESGALDRVKELSQDGSRALVIVFTNWCHVCHFMAPAFKKIAADPESARKVAHFVAIESNESTSSELGVRSFPTFFLFENGAKIAETRGGFGAPKLRDFAFQ